MEPGYLTQLVRETFVTPVTVAMDAQEILEDQEIGLLKQPQVEQPLLPEGKMVVVVVKDPALLNLQDQLQDPIQGPQPNQQITDETRAQKETTNKAPGGETKAITEIKAIGNVQLHKLVVLKGLQKGLNNLGQPLGNRPVLSVSNKNKKGQPSRLW